MASCDQEIVNQLCKINKTLLEIRDKEVFEDTQSGVYNSWTYLKVNKSWFLERLVTLSGSTLTVNLDLLDLIKAVQKAGVLPRAFQINRVEQIFNDATSRSYSVRAYSNPAFSEYVELANRSANTATSVVIQGGIEYKYPAEMRIQFYYSSFTADKTVRIRIQVDEL